MTVKSHTGGACSYASGYSGTGGDLRAGERTSRHSLVDGWTASGRAAPRMGPSQENMGRRLAVSRLLYWDSFRPAGDICCREPDWSVEKEAEVPEPELLSVAELSDDSVRVVPGHHDVGGPVQFQQDLPAGRGVSLHVHGIPLSHVFVLSSLLGYLREHESRRFIATDL